MHRIIKTAIAYAKNMQIFTYSSLVAPLKPL